MKKTEEQITQEIIFEHLSDKDRFVCGSHKGKPRCSKNVTGGTWSGHRCHKIAKYMEPDPWDKTVIRPFCRTHAPSQVKIRQAKKDDERDAVIKVRQDNVATRKAEFVADVKPTLSRR
ncbi:hypothetical protein LCGC14_2691770 [marine sediment metagenome]|uniref:Uncharacterized protein n=1 Tax=marine sediment metagenome TaxID=412755 RepID=A0A0F9BT10_9ZZZZ